MNDARRRLRHLARAAVAAILILLLAPVAVMLWASLSAKGISPESSADVSFRNYLSVLGDEDNSFIKSAAFTTALATVVTAGSIVVGLPAAFSLARCRDSKVRLAGGWVFSTRFLPPAVAAVPLFVVFSKLGLVGNPLTLMIMDLMAQVSFVAWVMRCYIADVPTSIDELAASDGLRPVKTLLYVIAPSLRLPIASVAAMVWLMTWNEYFFALLFCGETKPLPVVIASWNTYQGIQWGPACAAGVLAALPAVLILAFSTQRFVRGLSFGWSKA